ncbi:fungal-specific transcription factor domain-containing protein [Thelonectria olida]|uniref:Fungal-specific transcription factor domain-containing protein n=1 Tax=Thelonectria olida TaxID=1576542 RepID=A0A9P8VZH8_9HYPO|nr:fungal-specific transcription factor domain-containing protein [Thelonectria olida]
MTKGSGTRVERTRTFTGCRTCRSRHSKCDEAQPECGTCRRLGLVCGGYGGRLFWITANSPMRPEQQQSHRGSEYRYPLFSEAERRIMSLELSSSLGRKSATDLLSDIDVACEKSENNGKGLPGLVKGPFGVFPAQDELFPLSSSPQSSASGSIIHVDPELTACSDPDGMIEEIQRTDWSDQINEANFDLFVSSLDPTLGLDTHDDTSPGQLLISDPSMTNMFLDNPPAVEGLSLFSPSFVTRAIESGAMTVDATHDRPPTPRMDVDVPPPPAPSRGLLPSHANSQNIPEHAEPLLRYYKQQVDGATGMMQTKRKSPWQLIFLPCALETFAELSLWNGTSHTRYTILYTLLAHSAFQLHMTNKPGSFANHWREIGARHQEKAQQHLRNALQLEMFGPKQTKYKELLMAILALAMTSLYNGSHAFRIFLLDAERLIRLRGLTNANPYKTRLLHHMYTHLRVIAESVSLLPEAINTLDQSVTPEVSVRNFRLTEESLNIGLDPAHEKSLDVGYNDIHLQIQGQWKETLYPVIYGIPESLMTLLSQTISIANEKKRLEGLARINPKISVDLAHHVKTLETSIWSWSGAAESVGPARPPQTVLETEQELIDHPQARSMALAIHQALVIYFYRRVYDVNAMILQDNVRKTLDYLEPCLEQMIDDQDFVASLAWPAFIAASEAVAPDLQEKALRCLTVTDERGLYFTPKPARQIVSSIWERRKQSGDWTMSWPCIITEA